MGGATAEGPWVEGFGPGPSEALRDAVHAAGLALLGKMEGEERRAAEVELHEKPARINDALKALEERFRKWSERERDARKAADRRGEWGKSERYQAGEDAWRDAADEVKKVLSGLTP